jgi:LacI family transcriptional regulator
LLLRTCNQVARPLVNVDQRLWAGIPAVLANLLALRDRLKVQCWDRSHQPTLATRPGVGLMAKPLPERRLVSAGKREPTMVDVARTAGVSKTTVSRTLVEPLKVRSRTRSRVLAAMDELGYQVNVSARSLRTAKSSLVGLLVPAISNDVFGRIAEALEEDLRHDGIGLLIMSSGWSAEGERLALESFRARRVDALVASLVDDRDSQVAKLLASFGRPVVLLDREVRGLLADVVLTEQGSAIRGALEHLAALGHRSIGIATISPTVRPGREALAAFEASAGSLGMSPVVEMVVPYDRIDARAGREVAQRMLEAGATAILSCVPNSVTAGVLDLLRTRGLSVPEDISLIGFDESELASVKPPRLTVISRSLDDIGRHASRMVLTRLANPELAPRAVTLNMTLHVQDSTAAPAGSLLPVGP